MDLEIIMLSEIAQTDNKKTLFFMLKYLYWSLKNIF